MKKNTLVGFVIGSLVGFAVFQILPKVFSVTLGLLVWPLVSAYCNTRAKLPSAGYQIYCKRAYWLAYLACVAVVFMGTYKHPLFPIIVGASVSLAILLLAVQLYFYSFLGGGGRERMPGDKITSNRMHLWNGTSGIVPGSKEAEEYIRAEFPGLLES